MRRLHPHDIRVSCCMLVTNINTIRDLKDSKLSISIAIYSVSVSVSVSFSVSL